MYTLVMVQRWKTVLGAITNYVTNGFTVTVQHRVGTSQCKSEIAEELQRQQDFYTFLRSWQTQLPFAGHQKENLVGQSKCGGLGSAVACGSQDKSRWRNVNAPLTLSNRVLEHGLQTSTHTLELLKHSQHIFETPDLSESDIWESVKQFSRGSMYSSASILQVRHIRRRNAKAISMDQINGSVCWLMTRGVQTINPNES